MCLLSVIEEKESLLFDVLYRPMAEGLIVLLLTVVNLLLCVREERLYRTEVFRSTQDLLEHCEGTTQRHNIFLLKQHFNLQ